MKTPIAHRLRVADEVWIATALLHREQPARDDFSINEIVERARVEGLSEVLRAGVYVHAIQHCSAPRCSSRSISMRLASTR